MAESAGLNAAGPSNQIARPVALRKGRRAKRGAVDATPRASSLRPRALRAGRRLDARLCRASAPPRVRLWQPCRRCRQAFSVECDYDGDATGGRPAPQFCSARCSGRSDAGSEASAAAAAEETLHLPEASAHHVPRLRESRTSIPEPQFALGEKAVSQRVQSVVIRGALYDAKGDIQLLSSRLVGENRFERDIFPPLPQSSFASSMQGGISHSHIRWDVQAQQALMQSAASFVPVADVEPSSHDRFSAMDAQLAQLEAMCPFPENKELWVRILQKERRLLAANVGRVPLALRQRQQTHPSVLWERFQARHLLHHRAHDPKSNVYRQVLFAIYAALPEQHTSLYAVPLTVLGE